MPDRYTHAEERRIAEAVRSGEAPSCPRCGVVLDARSVPPRSDVSYVRDRLWLTCAGCRRTVVLDRREEG